MIAVKLIVLSVYFIYSSCFNHYCEICRNHTLCLYLETGPNIACKAYNKTALLTRVEINQIVNRINERRNYIATGLNKFLPQAANMKKIFWSFELAAFAQRWVDQCDQSLQPDKEDQCRDLVHTKVGQNIATILGPSPGLHAKSLVEMWYIQILKYKGMVTYYNQSWHDDTDYFTQLIWAETDSVGCGRARFYVESKNTIVERLVCNFAPKGNIRGKPVYTIGYPSTQCSDDMITDRKFTGLCIKRQNSTARKFTTQRSHVSSLLRILNLSNSSVKLEIDPIRNNLKQINNISHKSKDQRNQKIRHVYLNHTHGYVKRVSPLRIQNFWNPSMNLSYLNRNQPERGHSRVYHGYESHVHTHDVRDENYKNYRKYDVTTESVNLYSNSDYRKYGNQNYQCTRRVTPPRNNYAIHNCNTPSCTRGQKNDNCRQLTTVCHSNNFRQDLCLSQNCKSSNEFCPCSKQPTCYTIPTRCTCNINCKCLGFTPCPELQGIKDNINFDETGKSQEYKLYDVPAPLVVRSGKEKLTTKDSSPKQMYKSIKKLNSRTEYDEYHGQEKESNEHPKLDVEDRDYLYETFDSSRRNKRDLEEHATFRPFWEIEDFSYKRPSELKSIRYTTLGVKKNRKTKRITVSSKPKMVTESITITLKNTPNFRGINNYISEKYLSFDELMRLRKLTTEETYQNPRRKASDDIFLREGDNASSPTTEITTNTPFKRKKYCTRKLTCTWTVWTMSDGDILGGGGFDRGSKTPPGYVEGCTRTSTCTREFMDRNKMSTIPDSLSSEPTLEDEDYCERRSLNVQRRNLEEIIETDTTVDFQETYTDPITSTTEMNYETVSNSKLDTAMFVPQHSCVCIQDNARIKRDEFKDLQQTNNHNHKELIRKMNFKNYMLQSNIHSTQIGNAINSLKNTYQSVMCSCSGAIVIDCCNFFLCIFILLL